MSFYIADSEDGTAKSTIKFGSYDPLALDPKNTFKECKDNKMCLLRTVSNTSWDIKANEIKISLNDKTQELTAAGRVRFEPQLPYLYLPAAYYKVVVDEMNALHGGNVCDAEKNTCKFDKPCD